MMRRTAVLALLTVAAGCANGDAAKWEGSVTDSAGVAIVSNPAEGDWSLAPQPTLTKDLDIGTAEGEAMYQFGQVNALDVNERGDVYVLDTQASEVRVFDAQGKHLRTMGKRGSGPGEFSQMTMFIRVGAGDTVFVADLMGQRLAKLGPDGIEAGSYPLQFTNGIPMKWLPASDGRFAVQLRKMNIPGMSMDSTVSPDRVIIRDVAGTFADTVLELKSGNTMQFTAGGMKMRLFEAEPVWTLLEDGRMVRGRSDLYRLEVLTADGKLERVIQRPVAAKPVTDADKLAIKAAMEKLFKQQPGVTPPMIKMLLDNTDFAANYPVFGSITAGPNNTLWVQRVRTAGDVTLAEGESFDAEDINSPEWDVFDTGGRLLGMVSLPEGFIPLRVTSDAIYGRMPDELEVQHVVRIRVK